MANLYEIIIIHLSCPLNSLKASNSKLALHKGKFIDLSDLFEHVTFSGFHFP